MPEQITRPDGSVLELIETRPVDLTPGGRRPARTKARKQALDVLYAADLRGIDLDHVLAEFAADPESRLRPFAERLIRTVLGDRAALDVRISSGLGAGWSLDRLPRVDRCLARLALAEAGLGETDTGVVMSEYVRLAEQFSTDASPAFINGLLAGLTRG